MKNIFTELFYHINMTEKMQNLTYYIRYQEIVKEKFKAYYEKK